jgi:hypothetical protein
MSDKTHKVNISHDACGVLLQTLRTPTGEKETGKQIICGGQVEIMVDEYLWDNPRPIADVPLENMTQAQQREVVSGMREYDRKIKEFTLTEGQREACKETIKKLADKGALPKMRATAELCSEFGID